MRILVTGASGYLGRAIVAQLSRQHEVTAWGCRQTANGVVSVDLRDGNALKAAIKTLAVDVVVHCAAYRDPDFCEQYPDETRRLNVAPVAMLAESLPSCTQLLLVSSDYVFDGTSAPYSETDQRCPINVYGTSKVEAENAVMRREAHLIIRIPLLIGCGKDYLSSGFIAKTIESLRKKEPLHLDNGALRFPTDIRDVAAAVEFLIAHGATGTYHYSGQRGQTQYAWAQELGDIASLSTDHLFPLSKAQPRRARRPENSQLSTEKIRSLGFNQYTSFADTARQVLALRT